MAYSIGIDPQCTLHDWEQRTQEVRDVNIGVANERTGHADKDRRPVPISIAAWES